MHPGFPALPPILCGLLWLAAAVPVAAQTDPILYEDALVRIEVTPRTPEQVAAFYIGRKFPPAAVAFLRGQCFMTFRIHNLSPRVVWLDQGRWRFVSAERPVQRRGRKWLDERMAALGAPQSSRSTLRWTLLPERLDFRPDEAEGGNVVLARRDEPFDLEATFALGQEGDGGPLVVRFRGLQCASEGAP